MKQKNKGLSLIVAFGSSLLVVSIALFIFNSISRTLEKSANIERANQIFFAAESGAEAAFFHHNSRGQGVDFGTISSHDSQELKLTGISAQVGWTIEGQDEYSIGLLKEGETVQIPLYWNDSTDPTLDPTSMGEPTNNLFNLNFYNEIVNGGNAIEQALFDSFGAFNLPIESDLDFGNTNNEVLIDWTISRKYENGNDKLVQNFVPTVVDGIPCEDSNSSFICEDDFRDATYYFPITSTTIGKITPRSTFTPVGNVSLLSFLNETNANNYQITFSSPLSFYDSDTGDQIKGLPYSIEFIDSNPIPKNSYTLTSQVTIGTFKRNIVVEVPEQSSLGIFNYVILD